MTDAHIPTEQIASPSPWTMRLNKVGTSYGIWDAKGRYLAGGSWNDNGVSFPTQAENEVNMRMMGAAPDLLAALKEMGDWIAAGLQASDEAWPDAKCLQHTEEIAARARAAVDKAEGRLCDKCGGSGRVTIYDAALYVGQPCSPIGDEPCPKCSPDGDAT